MPQLFARFQTSQKNKIALEEELKYCMINYNGIAGSKFLVNRLVTYLDTVPEKLTREQRKQATDNLQKQIEKEKYQSQFLVGTLIEVPIDILGFITKYHNFAQIDENKETLLEALNKKLFTELVSKQTQRMNICKMPQDYERQRKKQKVIQIKPCHNNNQRIQTSHNPYYQQSNQATLEENYRQRILKQIEIQQSKLEFISSQLTPSKISAYMKQLQEKVNLAITKHFSIKIITSIFNENFKGKEKIIKIILSSKQREALCNFLKNLERTFNYPFLSTLLIAEQEYVNKLSLNDEKLKNLSSEMVDTSFNLVIIERDIVLNKDIISKFSFNESIKNLESFLLKLYDQERFFQVHLNEQKILPSKFYLTTQHDCNEMYRTFLQLIIKTRKLSDRLNLMPCDNSETYLNQTIESFKEVINFCSKFYLSDQEIGSELLKLVDEAPIKDYQGSNTVKSKQSIQQNFLTR